LVREEDLLLIVDGEDTWFQLPSDVIIKQYEAVIEYANARLLNKYGLNKFGYQKFNQTIVFGAEKMCEEDAMSCKYTPDSILPNDLYGVEEGGGSEDLPARYLNSKVVMGPAKDLKTFYDAALEKHKRANDEKQTMQAVLATMFGEQQLRRDAALIREKSTAAKLREWVGQLATEELAAERRLKVANTTLSDDEKHEFAIGLDYTHTLFQPLVYTTLYELVPLVHDNTTDLSKYRHSKTITPHLSLPPTLSASIPPFWSPNLALHNPSPNNQPAYIDKLDFSNLLDTLPDRHTPWSNIPLIQNTYTGAIPALILNVPKSTYNPVASSFPSADISFANMWYAPHKRALLRQYFRNPQSPYGYHNSLVGGDRFWDQRGGRGGIWTSSEQTWLPWGEVDGVCGTLAHLKQVFNDGKGVWMHELEADNEGGRVRDEEEYKKQLDEKRRKEEEKEKVKAQLVAQILKQEQDRKAKEKADKERIEEEERKKKVAEEERVGLQEATEIERQKKEQEEAETREMENTTAALTRRRKRWTA
jgi:hypothetical protein